MHSSQAGYREAGSERRENVELFRNWHITSMAPIVFAMVLLVAGCGGYGHKAYRDRLPVKADWYDVEVDDFGQYWSPHLAEAALADIEKLSRDTNTIVVLFAHGWHHNASAKSSNRDDFEITVAEVRKVLASKPYRDARVALGVGDDVRVIGIYLAWRGRSLPGVLDYLTFWGRKAAAERVGEGAARDFVFRLDEIYKRQPGKPENEGDPSRFMGLVLLGHSFGGQVIHKATSTVFEEELERKRDSPSDPVNGVGDLVVLINPALEAAQFHRIDALYRARPMYGSWQTPVLIVFSGEADFARQRLFPIGRWFSSLWRPGFRSPLQRQEWLHALGEVEHQRTHSLELDSRSLGFNFSTSPAYCPAVLPLDMTALNRTVQGSKLEPIFAKHIPNSPVLVAYSGQEIIEAHSGIFKPAFRNFLIDYVALIEGKRMCLMQARQEAQAAK